MDRRTILLVHAGASSLKSVDQQAVAQAEAYLSLRCHEPTEIASSTRSEPSSLLQDGIDIDSDIVARVADSGVPVHSDIRKQQNHDHMSARGSERYENPAVGSRSQTSPENIDNTRPAYTALEYIDNTQLAYTALESQLYTSSAAAAAASPTERFRPVPTQRNTNLRAQLIGSQRDSNSRRGSTSATQHHGKASETLCKRKSSLSDAPVATPTRESVRQIEDVRRKGADGDDHHACTIRVQKPLFESPSSSAPAVITPVRHVDTAIRSEGTPASNETTSELPRSYSWSVSTTNGRSNEHSSNEAMTTARLTDCHIDVVRDASPLKLAAEIQTSCDRSHPPAQVTGKDVVNELEVVTALTSAQAPVPHTSAMIPRFKLPSQPREALTTATFEAELRTLGAEIHARRPTVSVKAFDTHVTNELRALYGTFATTYKPYTVSRPISTLERGYWLINCASWSAIKKLAFWRHLENWIENGSAGWGVWCTRGIDQQLLPDIDAPLESSSLCEQETNFGDLRVYCWGEIIGHIYVLLYTASEGGVRKLGLRWIDAENKVVVQMNGGK